MWFVYLSDSEDDVHSYLDPRFGSNMQDWRGNFWMLCMLDKGRQLQIMGDLLRQHQLAVF